MKNNNDSSKSSNKEVLSVKSKPMTQEKSRDQIDFSNKTVNNKWETSRDRKSKFLDK